MTGWTHLQSPTTTTARVQGPRADTHRPRQPALVGHVPVLPARRQRHRPSPAGSPSRFFLPFVHPSQSHLHISRDATRRDHQPTTLAVIINWSTAPIHSPPPPPPSAATLRLPDSNASSRTPQFRKPRLIPKGSWCSPPLRRLSQPPPPLPPAPPACAAAVALVVDELAS